MATLIKLATKTLVLVKRYVNKVKSFLDNKPCSLVASFCSVPSINALTTTVLNGPQPMMQLAN